MTRLALCTVAALALVGLPTHAAEKPLTGFAANSTAVSYADLDLTRDAGAQTLLRRIRMAADVACGPAPDIRDLDAAHLHSACTEQAVTKAVDSVGSSLLTALYGKSAPIAVADR